MTNTYESTLVDIHGVEQLTLELLEDGRIGVLTINRPERMNSQTVRMFTEQRLVSRALRDMPLHALIVRGAGKRAFSAGFDLDEIEVITRMGVREFLKFQETASRGLQAIRELPFPVIAAVHGPATGSGFALALSADIRMADPVAKFSAGFLPAGLSTGGLGLSYDLTRLVGPAKAAVIGYTACHVSALDAHSMRLINHVYPTEDLFDRAVELARLIAGNSRQGVRMSKRAIQRNQEITSYAAALELENRGQALMSRTEDMPEALHAFLENRTPRFVGR